MSSTSTTSATDVQAQAPRVPVSLSRVGVTETEKVVRLITPEGEHPYHATFECVVELGGHQKGAHMSRFEEVINDTIGELVVGASTTLRAEDFAAHIAEVVRERQGARRAEVRMVARYPEEKPAPLSGIATQEIYTLIATASASERGTRRIIGVQAQGMTACPCAQGLIEASSHERLLGDGFTEDEIARIFAAVPVATHNQRGLGTLEIGLPEGDDTLLDARTLVAIVEASMSSEIFELMKRSDEGAVVERAHRNPRFVEDCVRETIAGVVDHLPTLSDHVWIGARQENLETIHQHNVIASRVGLLGELRGEMRGDDVDAQHLGRDAWLAGR
ncbi:MAG: GTP cyclohydrolase MptA [Solirubrobacteraceae bacterium]|nr:GTP cyclohydrolase MptA [Patulibacter sp.]